MKFAFTFDHGKHYTEALKHGIARRGDSHAVITWTDHFDLFDEFDVVVFNGMNPKHDELRRVLTIQHKPFIVVDLGYMKRGSGAADTRRDRYYQVGWNRIGYVPPKYRENDRSRFDSLDLNVVDDRDLPTGDVLIIGQVQKDTQHNMSHVELNHAYIDAAFRMFRRMPKSKIIMRRHPRAPQRFDMPDFVEDQSGTEVRLIDALLDARCIVTINSTTFYEATLAGVPVISGDESICHYASETTKLFEEELKLRTAEQKLPFLRRMAHAQFTVDEMADGTAIDSLLQDYDAAVADRVVAHRR